MISLTDSSGTLLNINKYDEYGVPQSTNLGKFGYTGQAWVPEVGLWYYKARFYRPDIGRFMQTDPIGYAAGMNLYAYVGNDPVNWVDPLGLIRICYTVYITTVQPDGTSGTRRGERCIERMGRCQPIRAIFAIRLLVREAANLGTPNHHQTPRTARSVGALCTGLDRNSKTREPSHNLGVG